MFVRGKRMDRGSELNQEGQEYREARASAPHAFH